MSSDSHEAQKRASALAAIGEVRSGMLVGLGTGTTAAYLIDALAKRVGRGLTIRAVATSEATADHARRVGIDLLDLGDMAAVDLAIDGVDQIDPRFRAIKGGGGALLREKIVAQAATRMIAMADDSKPVQTLNRAVPIEVMRFARNSVEKRLCDLGGKPIWRDRRSDQGNLLLDCDFGTITAPARLASDLSVIPGLVAHGLFLTEINVLYLATENGVRVDERNASVPED